MKYVLLLLTFITLTYNIFSTEVLPAQNIDTILITAESEEDYEAPGQISIISEDEIAALPSSSTPEIVASVMGVSMSKMGNDASPSFISIRGSSPEQVLVLLNGKRMNSAQGGGVDLSSIDPETIKKIEVIRGGSSAVYGESAFGGIVNIITNDIDESYIKIKYDYNLENRNTISLNLYKISETFTFSGNIYGLYNPGDYTFTLRDEEKQRLNSDIKSISSALNFNWLISTFDFNFNNHFYLADKGVPGIIEFPSESARIQDFEVISFIDINYVDLFNFDITYLNKIRDYQDQDSPLGAVKSKHDYKSLSSLISYNNLVELSSKYDYLDSSTIDENIYRTTISLYLSPQFTIKNLLIKPSSRIDYVLDTDPAFSWNIGFIYNFDVDKKYILKSSIANAYRLPSFNDLFWPQTSFAVGNADLKNENAIIFDLGLIAMLTESLKLETTLYYHSISNLIQWNPGPSGVWSPKNLGKAEIKGIETELSYLMDSLPIHGYLEGRINYTYLSALNKDNGILYNKQLINRSAHKGNCILIYYHESNLIISLDLNYTGESYITAANTKTNPEYLLLDLNVTIPINKYFELSVYGKNLLNESYTDYRGYPVPGLTAGINIEYKRSLNE